MGGVEDAAAQFRVHGDLHHRLFRGGALGVGVECSESRLMVIGLMVLAIWVWDTAWHERGRLLDITFLDVGQGDAAFVRFPDGKTMLVDGGANSSRIEVTEAGITRRVGYDNGERTLDPFLCHEGHFLG